MHIIRTNWYKERLKLKKDDIVWVIDHRLKWGFYRLGRMKKFEFGSDGHFRSSDVLTQSRRIFIPATMRFSRVLDDNWCVPPQERHRAGDEKA